MKKPITLKEAKLLLSQAERWGWFGTHRFLFDEKDKKIGRGLHAVWLLGSKRLAFASDAKGDVKTVIVYETETNGPNVFHGKDADELFDLGSVRMKFKPREQAETPKSKIKKNFKDFCEYYSDFNHGWIDSTPEK